MDMSGGGEVRRVLLVCNSLCFDAAEEVFNLTRTGQSWCSEAKVPSTKCTPYRSVSQRCHRSIQ